jgi:hypothetical protein
MSNGYRGLAIAASGIALFTALFFGAYFGSLYGPDKKQYQAVSSQGSGQNDYSGPSQSLPDIAGLPSPVERAIANPSPATGADHEKRDLAAQEASALWAFWMTFVSAMGFCVTTVATVLLYQQIRLTREAVEDTGKATLAMQRQNELTEYAQRPWVKISAELVSVELDERRVIIIDWIVKFENIGQMVAHNFQPVVKFKSMDGNFFTRMAAYMDDFPGDIEEIDAVLIPRDINVFKGQSHSVIEYLPWETRDGFRKDCVLTLIAMVRYRIPGDDKWRVSMQGFAIAENLGNVDDSHFRYDFPDDLSINTMHIRKLGRSRAT